MIKIVPAFSQFILLYLLLVGMVGCTGRTTKEPDPFLQSLTSTQEWNHQRLMGLRSSYLAADPEQQTRYRSAFTERVLSEPDHETARRLFRLTFNDSWFEHHPEMRQDILQMMQHVNQLAVEQNKHSEFQLLTIDGKELMTERVGVH